MDFFFKIQVHLKFLFQDLDEIYAWKIVLNF